MADYRIIDAKSPGAVAAIRDRSDLSAGSKRKILGENAARLYRL